jgi:hypothetical protein
MNPQSFHAYTCDHRCGALFVAVPCCAQPACTRNPCMAVHALTDQGVDPCDGSQAKGIALRRRRPGPLLLLLGQLVRQLAVLDLQLGARGAQGLVATTRQATGGGRGGQATGGGRGGQVTGGGRGLRGGQVIGGE